jgi:DNA-binding NarL/FixJ family response regulator
MPASPSPRPTPVGDIRRGIGVLVVDDQLVFRSVAREVIEATDNFELVGEAASGPQALALVAELRPDLVLLDVRMPGMDGIETAARLHSAAREAVVILISIEEATGVPQEFWSCGAAELVRKQDFSPGLLRRVWESHGRHDR